MTKKVILERAGIKQDEPKGFVKAVQDEVVRLTKTKNRVYVPVKEGPVKLRSVKAKKSGAVLTECKGFAKKMKKGSGPLWNGRNATVCLIM